MKKITFLIFAASLMAFSCTPDANDPLEEQLEAYTWKITNMSYLGEDQTPEYEFYVFDFVNASSITAVKDDSTFTGSWNRSGGSQDNPSITIDFGPHYLLHMLNEQWLQDERTNQAVIFSTANDSSKVTFEIVP